VTDEAADGHTTSITQCQHTYQAPWPRVAVLTARGAGSDEPFTNEPLTVGLLRLFEVAFARVAHALPLVIRSVLRLAVYLIGSVAVAVHRRLLNAG